MVSKNETSPSADAKNWRELYIAALFERDREKLPSRIDAAETALLSRGRELFVSHDNIDEAEAVDQALYAIRALRTCLKLGTRDPDAA
jgi:hypothetical protein